MARTSRIFAAQRRRCFPRRLIFGAGKTVEIDRFRGKSGPNEPQIGADRLPLAFGPARVPPPRAEGDGPAWRCGFGVSNSREFCLSADC
jgi:hypothetical protein